MQIFPFVCPLLGGENFANGIGNGDAEMAGDWGKKESPCFLQSFVQKAVFCKAVREVQFHSVLSLEDVALLSQSTSGISQPHVC